MQFIEDFYYYIC